jgi:radical SAM superfamily enzyme
MQNPIIKINIHVDGNGQKQLQDVLNAYNLTLTINKPTRVREKTATVIDHIITNIPAECFYTEMIGSFCSV